MFTRFVAVVLILCVSFSNFTRFMVFTSFKINQTYIAATLCVNKNKPEVRCEGKCYLTKKLKQADEKEKSPDQVQKKHQYEALVVSAFRLAPPMAKITNLLVTEPGYVLSTYYTVIFQPPQA